ncbi:MAG: sigma 54-interacting transcriptional regulator [Sandaracinaceae bacterium]
MHERTERWVRPQGAPPGPIAVPVVELCDEVSGDVLYAPAGLGTSGIGSHPSNDLVLDEPTVSRFHAEVVVAPDGVRVRDVGSSNGTSVDGVTVRDAFVRDGSIVQLGRARIRVTLGGSRPVEVGGADRFGGLVGRAPAMRALFEVLERCAASDATVLLEGETGTGKEAIAEAIHAASRRADQPFVVLDCSAIPHDLVESELFGHERGAFTGAVASRIGAFEEAHGGTLFVDEIGELPADLQPKLLRALEQRTVRKVGAQKRIAIDVRVIAATNRTLREEVNAGRFRADLFYRLAVVRVDVPPLRERIEDLGLLVGELSSRLGATPEQQREMLAPAFLDRLARSPWPGNVRELRNVLERSLVLGRDTPLDTEAAPALSMGSAASTGSAASPGSAPMGSAALQGSAGSPGIAGSPGSAAPTIDPRLSYQEARERALAEFEARYLEAALALTSGNVAKTARDIGLDRTYLHRLLRKHGLR